MTDWQDGPADHEIMALFREAVAEKATPSEGFVDLVMAGYDLMVADADIAELTLDTDLHGAQVSVRSSDAGSRLLTFSAPTFRFEFEIGHHPPEVTGQVEPPLPGTVVFEQAGSVQSVELDDEAEFAFSLAATLPFRLKYVSPSGTSVTTEWVLP